jgi:hypothetical protein
LTTACPKPEPRGPKPPARVRRSAPVARKAITHNRQPRCTCGNKYSEHAFGAAPSKPACLKCDGCRGYEPARKSAPARTKRKLMPKCKHCAQKHKWHSPHGPSPLIGCEGYEPAIGIRQKRRTPAAALKLRCDELWSKLVKARVWVTVPGCEIQRFYPHTCGGERQAMHGVPRTFAATRHLLINGFDGCRDIHKFFTDRPELWSSVLLDAWGEPTFRELWSKARAMQPVDMSATYAALKAEAAARVIE